MGFAISEEHVDLAKSVEGFLDRHAPVAVVREMLEAEHDEMPALWSQIGAMGWLGLHVPETFGGEGFGLAETAVLCEQFGEALAPGPLISTIITSAVLTAAGTAELQAKYLPELAAGRLVGATGVIGNLELAADKTVTGDAGPVLSAGLAELLLLRVGSDIAVVRVDKTDADKLQISPDDTIDPVRRPAWVRCAAVLPEAVLPGAAPLAVAVARTVAATEAAGIARACSEMATQYAKDREQFGRAIGTFQAVKHMCADTRIDAERAAAVAWGAARSDEFGSDESKVAAATAYSVAVRAAISAAERNIQIHGGIGFTWEHDAHLYLRRALTLRAVFGAPDDADADIATAVAAGTRPSFRVELPEEAEQFRAEAQKVAACVAGLSREAQRTELVSSGYLVPHWARPWGLGATPVQQLVIEEEFADIRVPSLGITGWNILTIIQHGTAEQHQRWVEKTLQGELAWCQLFSEPGAGSDAAAITTSADRVDGGWKVTGQKVWTSGAHRSQWGFATVRTDASGPKHAGITMMAIDMSAPGVDVRPLRELTGQAVFNEVFLDEVFVPDSDVVGEVGRGWEIARATLGNERVSIGGAPGALKVAAFDLVDLIKRRSTLDRGHMRCAGRLIAEDQSLVLLNLRQVVRAVEGSGPGPEGNVTKLLRAEHIQRVTEFAMELIGQDAVGDTAGVVPSYLLGRCYTIAGGTSEIVRNQIAERILGLPRDPLQR